MGLKTMNIGEYSVKHKVISWLLAVKAMRRRKRKEGDMLFPSVFSAPRNLLHRYTPPALYASLLLILILFLNDKTYQPDFSGCALDYWADR